jgi:hypothetical protein
MMKISHNFLMEIISKMREKKKVLIYFIIKGEKMANEE